jgi:hypothetical protein
MVSVCVNIRFACVCDYGVCCLCEYGEYECSVYLCVNILCGGGVCLCV